MSWENRLAPDCRVQDVDPKKFKVAKNQNCKNIHPSLYFELNVLRPNTVIVPLFLLICFWPIGASCQAIR